MRFASLVLVFCFVALSAVAQTPPAPPLSDYAANETASWYVVSPDGAQVAYLQSTPDGQRLIVEQAGRPIYAGNLGAAQVSLVQWYSPRHVLIVSRVSGDSGDGTLPLQTFSQATAVNVERRTSQRLLRRQPGVVAALNGTPWPAVIDGQPHAMMPAVNLSDLRFPLFAVPLDGGWPRQLDNGDFNTKGYLTDPTGALVARTQFDDPADVWRLQARRDGGWATVLERRTGTPPDLDGLGRTPGTVILRGAFDGGDDILEVDLSTGAVRSLSPDGRRAGSAWFDTRTGRLLAVQLRGDRPEYRFQDASLQTRWDAIVRAFPHDSVILRSITDDHSQVTIMVDGPTRTGSHFHLVNLVSRRVEPLTDPRPALSGALGEVRGFNYRAADGLELEAVLTLPIGRQPRGLPLVVLVHDGPNGQARTDFNYRAQALAARGYAVLEPNFRGSTSSPELFAAGNGQWGRRMQSDLSDGVAALVAAGIADPTRVCILGAGYGGYAALAGVVMQRDVYRCAVSVNGISDLPPLLRIETYTRGPGGALIALWRRLLGLEAEASPREAAPLSPLAHARNASAPILLIHSELEGEIPPTQSRVMRDALRSARRPVEHPGNCRRRPIPDDASVTAAGLGSHCRLHRTSQPGHALVAALPAR